jgi:hypothetical protein
MYIYISSTLKEIYISTSRKRARIFSPVGHKQEFTLSDLGVFLGVVGGIMTSTLLTVQKSKCKKIECCKCECDRDPTTPDEKAKPGGKGMGDKP